ncbi:hypothetical protein BJ742DRAFT_901081 [Cladochytrium replicatum]|nr:hypothetical protein BJ742DRAFT_901081 [Cladochytrium replicatum]
MGYHKLARLLLVTTFAILAAAQNGTSSGDDTIEPAFANPAVAFVGGSSIKGFVLRDPTNKQCIPRVSTRLAGITNGELTCEPVGIPGQNISIRYNKTYVDHVVRFDDWKAYFYFSFDCLDPNRRNTTIIVTSNTTNFKNTGTVTQNITLPGIRPTNGQKEELNCLDLSPFGRLSLVVQSLDNDNAVVSLSIPFNLNVTDRQIVSDSVDALFSRIGKDNVAALTIALIALIFLATWSSVLYLSYRARRARYVDATARSNRSKVVLRRDQRVSVLPENIRHSTFGRTVEIEEDVTKPKDFSSDMLDALAKYSEGVKIHIAENGYEKLCKGIDDLDAGQKVSSAPSATRVNTLGRTGMSIYQLFPFRLASIGSTTMVVGSRGELIKLPRMFTYSSAHWLALVFLIIVFALGILCTDVAFTGTVDANFGYFWLAGGVGLIGTVVYMHSTVQAPTKGMLRLFRSIAAPTTEEFMFSYCWVESCRPDDIRTLARAMYEIGLYVWIDTVKLISGSMISSSLINAVRTANTVVIFLSPEYLSRRNTSTEHIEALHYPAKIHLHVVKWDTTVYGAVDVLVNVFKVPKERITAHKFEGEKLFLPLSSDIKELNRAMEFGTGWYDFAAMLNAYSKDDNDILDFQWWIKYASNLGGIPSTAPYPKHIRPWNFLGLIPGLFEWTARKDVRVGNVWIRGDARYTGKRASAFPWFIIPLVLFMLFPVADIVLILSREFEVLGEAQLCANRLQTIAVENRVRSDDLGHKFNETTAMQAICRRFHRSEAFTTKYSAFSMDPVMRIFDQLHDQFQGNCTAKGKDTAYWLNPQLSGKYSISQEPCVFDLQYYFSQKDYFAPRNVHATFFAILFLLYLFLVVLNFNQALNYDDPPACLRPLLATANLVRKTTPSNVTNDDSSSKTKTNGSFWNKSDDEESNHKVSAKKEPEEEILIPEVKVAVHGTGQVADTLRKFLDSLGFLADPTPFDELGRVKPIIAPSTPQLVYGEPSEHSSLTAPPRNHSFIPKLPFVWVDVFVISTPEYRDQLYAIRDTLRYEQMVVVLGNDVGAPRVTDGSTESGRWLFSVMFIDCNDSKLSFAKTVLENISLRTKDALMNYGKEAFSKTMA